MRKPVVSLGTFLAMVCLLSACSSKPSSQPFIEAGAPTSKAAAPAALPSGSGVIHGTVKFRGPKPMLAAIDFSSNPQCQRAHPRTVRAETVFVNPDHTLRDTFVWIKSGLPPAHFLTPVNSVTLDQDGCLYRPRVIGLMVNQELEIRNSDPVNHDVHVESVANAASNDVEPPRSETLRKRFPRQEIWFPVTCGLHPWMRSFLSVVAHPFFQVTGSDGHFQLAGLPPGTYVLEAIQEKFGRREQSVTLAASEEKTADFVYAE